MIVVRAKRRRSASPSWPSCAIAVAGASVPVASAIATGKDNTTAIQGDPSGPVVGARPRLTTGSRKPCTSVTTAVPRKIKKPHFALHRHVAAATI
jgi:hypothetical protein